VSITNREKLNLQRFGCTLKESTGVFLVDWKGKRAAHALSANIFARLACFRTRTAPIVLLALEISSVRPLPLYFYFPFDLKSKAHRKCLSHLTSTGEIRLHLLNGKRPCKRTHRLTPYLRERASEIYAEALQVCESIEQNKYDFNSGLQFVEHHVRIPQLLNRVLLEDTVRVISDRIEEAIQAAPNENRELARKSVRAAAEAFSPYYRNNRTAFLETLYAAQLGSTCVIDLHSLFADNSEGLAKFLTDVLGATLSRQQLGALAELVGLVVASSKLPFKELAELKEQLSTTELTPRIPEPPSGLTSLVQFMGASGISKDTASKFFELIGLEVGGKPGRPTKDYSGEYEAKASGLSWTKVASKSLRENPEFREEFGERDFQSLTFEERETLKNRIREGVRTYAERTGKPFPIETVGAIRDQDRPAEK
jgi:hypothetical protein